MAFSGLTRAQMVCTVLQKYLLDHPVDAGGVTKNTAALTAKRQLAKDGIAALTAVDNGNVPAQVDGTDAAWPVAEEYAGDDRVQDVVDKLIADHTAIVATSWKVHAGSFGELLGKIPAADDVAEPDDEAAVGAPIMDVLSSIQDRDAKGRPDAAVINLCYYLVESHTDTSRLNGLKCDIAIAHLAHINGEVETPSVAVDAVRRENTALVAAGTRNFRFGKGDLEKYAKEAADMMVFG